MFRCALLFLMLPLFCTVASAQRHPTLPAPTVPDALGVNIHFTDPKPGEMEMRAAGGFKWVRMDFTWAGTERERGQYDFSAYDRLVTALDEHEIKPLLARGYLLRRGFLLVFIFKILPVALFLPFTYNVAIP
ncbi:MAG TPA: hypothetical protein VF600_06420 [Abditibacteriaceae bacterium]|jgi:hypothetical protein